MPKRRMTSRRRAQIKAWQLAGARARKTVVPEYGSFSDPHLGREKLGWSPRKQRTIKYMGKAALKHSNPTSSVTIAPWAKQVLNGEKVTAHPLHSVPPSDPHSPISVSRDGRAYRRTDKQQKKYLSKLKTKKVK
jgi:hypothetical protein